MHGGAGNGGFDGEMAAGDVTSGPERRPDGPMGAAARGRLSGLHDLTRRYGARAGIFLASFALAKAAAYLGPLLLARMLAPQL